MSEKEFDVYLSVLSKLLRLSPAQKAAISDEVRDHLEQRLEQLLRSGATREEAIKTAMDEFGDVSGLALDFTRVSRTPVRTVLLRSTIVASVVAVLIVGWVTLFAPEHRLAAPVPVQAQQAQKPNEAPATPPADSEVEKPGAGAELAALNDAELFPAFLTKLADVNFVDVPLTEVCQFLAEAHDVPVMIQRQALQDEGNSLDSPITLVLNGLSFEEVLNHVTKSLELAWYVDDGVVQITTQTAADERLMTRNWDLSRLTQRGHSLTALYAAFRLGAEKWQDFHDDGGTMSKVGESVVIRQTWKAQRRIAQLLAAIEQQQPTAVLGTCTGRDHLLEVLKQPSSTEFVETPLAEALKFLAESHQVQILLDEQALSDEGIDVEVPVTLTIRKRPLGKVLNLFLGELSLTYVLRDGVIWVTTRTKADELMELVVYNVHDFVTTGERLAELIGAIRSATSGQWDEDADSGSIAPLVVSGCLVVKQTDTVHAEIQAMIEQLRRSHGNRADVAAKPEPRPKMVTKNYRMPKDVASDLVKALPKLVSPENWQPKDGETPTIELIASSPRMEEVDGLVSGGQDEVRVMNPPKEKPNPADKAEPTAAQAAVPAVKSIVVRPRSTLVICQTPEVHREIWIFLRNLNAQVEPGMPQGAMGGMGGGMGGMGGGMF